MEMVAALCLYWFLLRPRLRRIEKHLGLDHNKSCGAIADELDEANK